MLEVEDGLEAECAPHQYPLDEHSWSVVMSSSHMGSDNRTGRYQVCTNCNWYVLVITTVETLISGGEIGDRE